jgi:glycosyltransferase involved in cell wall biosynthesis
MKIAMIGQKGIYPIYGGVESHVEELSTRLAALDHEVTVYSRPWYSKPPFLEHRGVTLEFIPSIHTKHFDTITHVLFSTVHALFQNYDVIHYHGVGPSLLCWIPRLFNPSVSVVATIHCLDRFHGKWGRFARFMLGLGEWCALRFSHKTLVVSHELQRYCEKTLHQSAIYIPSGFSERKQDDVPLSSASALEMYNLSVDGYILCVARFTAHKGIHTLLNAFTRLPKLKIKLVIVGEDGTDPEYGKLLRNLAIKDHRVKILTGVPREYIFQLYESSLFVVQPSEAEGLSIVILEALSCGKAVLCSDIAANREMISSSKYRFKTKDVTALSKKLRYFSTHRKELITDGEQGRLLVHAEYAWEKIVPKVITVYRGAIHRGKASFSFLFSHRR